MTDSTAVDSSQPDEPGESSPFQVALGFFILPLLLVLGGVGVFLLFGVLAHESTDPASYLPAITGGGINEPWQAAFHLSQQLEFNDDLHNDPKFAGQVARALVKSGDADPRVRRFLTVALGRIGHSSAVPTLVDHSRDTDDEVRLNSLWALGTIGDLDAAPAVAERLQDDASDVRTMAAYVLGVLRHPDTRAPLTIALNDSVPAVRWNSAVALGLMGDPAALELLGKMIDRKHLASVPGVTENDVRQTMLAALAALRILPAAGLQQQLTSLRDSDPDLRVRNAAREALAVAQSTATGNAESLLAQGR